MGDDEPSAVAGLPFHVCRSRRHRRPSQKSTYFKGRLETHLIRDEGVAGSNPATPTSFIVAQTYYGA